MKTVFVLGSALLLTTTPLARAAELQEPTSVPSTMATPPESAVPNSALPEASARPVATETAPVQATTQGAESVLPPPSQPEPDTGWGRGVRAPMYLNLMLSVGAFAEDGDNRLTTRDSKILEGFGGVLRIGAVLGKHHRLGARMQSFVRPTKKVLMDPPAATATNEEWGAVTFGFIGPEYLYTTDLGLYAGGSVGVGGAVSNSKTDQGKDDDNHLERGSAGVAGILSLGYEWRANKWFAMNAEVFGGLYHGLDDNENSMNGGIFGLGAGLGF